MSTEERSESSADHNEHLSAGLLQLLESSDPLETIAPKSNLLEFHIVPVHDPRNVTLKLAYKQSVNCTSDAVQTLYGIAYQMERRPLLPSNTLSGMTHRYPRRQTISLSRLQNYSINAVAKRFFVTIPLGAINE